MPKLNDTPIGLKALTFHGVEFHTIVGNQGRGDCPFCGKEGKYYCNIETGENDCKSCMVNLNNYTFFKKLWEISKASTNERDYRTFALDRRVKPETLKIWGVCKSSITGEWLVPGFNHEGKLIQLYKYSKTKRLDKANNKWYEKMILLMTSGVGNDSSGNLLPAMFGVNLLTSDVRSLYIAEGPWDSMALWESLKSYTNTGKKLKVTANETESLLNGVGVIGVPGAGVFNRTWTKLLENKAVRFCYDSDYKRESKVVLPSNKNNSGEGEQDNNQNSDNGHSNNTNGNSDNTTNNIIPITLDGAGLAGTKHAVNEINKSKEEVKSIEYLRWGPDGFDPTKPDGWDIRDELNSNPKAKGEVLQGLLQKFFPIPEEWIKITNTGKESQRLLPIECKEWSKVINSLRAVAKVTDGIKRALAVMLASIISVEQPEDQLWVKIISPASGFKTTLCEALAISRKYVKMTSINGFYSGYKTDSDGTEDHSMINQLRNKTLVVKDGDTLIQQPNLSQILAEARDIYDKSGGKSYRSDVKREYSGIHMTWILCGTSSLRVLDSSELGERFLTSVIMEKIDPKLEYEIGMRKVNHIRSIMGRGRTQIQNSQAKMNKFKQLTGGYIDYLRSNADQLIDKVYMSDESAELCCKLGTFVAYMRARPSLKQDEDVEREMCPRLVSQITKLAFCLAAVMGKDEVDCEVMDYVCKVASDTARGKTARITKQLYKVQPKGMHVKGIALWNTEKESKMLDYLRFLSKIDVVRLFDASEYFGVGAVPRFRLTETVARLYSDIMKSTKEISKKLQSK